MIIENAQYNLSETFTTGTGLPQGDSKTGDMPLLLPSIAFSLGVFGNLLAITWLVLDTYHKRCIQPCHQTIIRRRPQHSLVSRWSRSSQNLRLSVSPREEASLRRKKNPGHFRKLLLALLSMDLAGTLFTSPVTIHVYKNGGNITTVGGEPLCRYSAFAMMFFGIATMALLMTMAVERLLSVQFPFYAVTAKRAKLSIAFVLCSCAIFCAFPPAGLISIKQMYPGTWCFADTKNTKDMVFNVVYASIGLILICTTVICNIVSVIAIVKLRIRKKNVYSNSCHAESEMQNIIQVSIITGIYVICWTPLVTRTLLNSLGNTTNGDLDRAAIWLAVAHPILDPWVYILFRKWVWKLILNTIKYVFLPCFPAHVQKTDETVLDAAVPLQEIVANKAKSDASTTKDTRINQACSTSTEGEGLFSTTLNKTSSMSNSSESLYDNNHT